MNDPDDHQGDLDDAELAALADVLARPGSELWTGLPAGLEDAVVEAIGAEVADDGAAIPVPTPADPVPLDAVGRRRRSSVPWWLSAAAAVAVIVAGVALLTRGGDADAVEFSLAGTEAAPGASAEVVLSATPAGMRILLDADGLPGAPEGTYYEAWLNNGEVSVSAGTFHLRGGNGRIELWAGVVSPDFDRLAITLEPIDGDAESSGDARLVGTFELGD